MTALENEANNLAFLISDPRRKLLWNGEISLPEIQYTFLPSSLPASGIPIYYQGSILTQFQNAGIKPETFAPLVGTEYETAINNILLTPTTDYRVSFSEVIPVSLSIKTYENGEISGSGAITYFQSEVEGDLGALGFPNERAADHLGGITVPGSFGGIGKAAIGFNSEELAEEGTAEGSGAYWVLMHETAHALGLNHTDDFRWKNKDTTDAYADYADSVKYSIMSVLPAYGFGGADFESYVLPYTLQLLDIYSLQSIWEKREYNTRPDADTYSLTPDIGRTGTYELEAPFFYTIWDGGGEDTIDVSGYDTSSTPLPAQIDLRQGRFSSIGSESSVNPKAIAWDITPAPDDRPAANQPGKEITRPPELETDRNFTKEYVAASVSSGLDPGNVAIAYHTVIENAIGTKWADSLIGNDWVNTLEGGEGVDQVFGDGLVYDGDHGYSSHTDEWDLNDPNDPSSPSSTKPDGVTEDNDKLIGGHGADKSYGG